MNDEGQSPGAEYTGLPPHPFLYTIDQIASLIQISEKSLKDRWIYYEGRTTKRRSRQYISAVNISPPEIAPEWRVSEVELVRWMRACGFRVFRNPARL